MNNILKNRDKILLILLFSLISIFISDGVKSQRGNKRNVSGKSKKNKITSVKPSNIKESNSDTKIEENDVSNINKYNCETLYNKCMNKNCYSETNGRCSCNDTNKFNSSDKECSYIYNACSGLADDIIKNYKRMAKSDCSNFSVQDIKNSKTSLSNIVFDVVDCMKPKCRTGQNEFVACFDNDNFEKKFELCKNTYKNISDTSELKEILKSNIKTYKEKYCNEIYGTLKEDGECYLTIGIGASYKTIKKTKEFKVGDNILCSENDFGVDLGESKHQKIRDVKEIVLFGVDTLQKITDIVSVGVSQKQLNQKNNLADNTNTKKALNTSADILTYSSMGLDAVVGSQHLGGALIAIDNLKNSDFHYSGYCYVIKDSTIKQLFGTSDEYFYKLRWSDSWNSSMYSKEDMK